MEVVAHQHVGMNRHLEFWRIPGEQGEHAQVIRVVKKYGLAVVTRLEDVMDMPTQAQAREAGHRVLFVDAGNLARQTKTRVQQTI